MRIILDTNVLFLFGQERIDVFAEIERAVDKVDAFLVPEPVMDELEKLAAKASKDGRAAKLGLALVRERERRSREGPLARFLIGGRKEIPLKTVRGSGEKHADDAILRIAEDDPAAVVATLDKGLQRRLLKAEVRVLGVRQKQFAFIG